MSDYLLVSQREDDQYIEKLKTERDALAARCRELEAVLESVPILTGDGNPENRGWEPNDVLTISYGRWNEWFMRRKAALASSGGTGAATSREQAACTGCSSTPCICEELIAEEAGRADSSASDEERARAWLREHYHDVRMGAATPSLANLIAAIRHEAMAQAIAASIRALAGDAPTK